LLLGGKGEMVLGILIVALAMEKSSAPLWRTKNYWRGSDR